MHLILQKGDKGKDVEKIQNWLNSHGYKAGEEDGEFGEKTRNAVIEFQSTKNIKTDGIAGSQTQITMERMDKES
jgi:peptidoglycan hydrolase-like protein with peptidoglycan-binding domain